MFCFFSVRDAIGRIRLRCTNQKNKKCGENHYEFLTHHFNFIHIEQRIQLNNPEVLISAANESIALNY